MLWNKNVTENQNFSVSPVVLQRERIGCGSERFYRSLVLESIWHRSLKMEKTHCRVVLSPWLQNTHSSINKPDCFSASLAKKIYSLNHSASKKCKEKQPGVGPQESYPVIHHILLSPSSGLSAALLLDEVSWLFVDIDKKRWRDGDVELCSNNNNMFDSFGRLHSRNG